MQNLINEYRTYAAEKAAHDAQHPFDLLTFLDAPTFRAPTAREQAGELLVGGREAALTEIVKLALTGDLDDTQRQIALFVLHGAELADRGELRDAP